MEKKVLLTGSSGFLGKVILSELSNTKNKIYTLSRSGGDFKFALEKLDLNFRIKFDLIIHAAG